MSTEIENWDRSRSEQRPKETPNNPTRSDTAVQGTMDAWDTPEGDRHSKPELGVFAHPDFTPKLIQYLIANPKLQESLTEAVECLKSELSVDVTADLNRDMEDLSHEKPTIEINAHIESAEDWLDLKSDVRDIVRASEEEDQMIYTIVNRS